MSDHEDGRPLTRRELRLREMIEAGEQAGAEGVEAASSGDIAAALGGIEVALFDEHGRLRSRRELRELREQAEAALRGEQEGEQASASVDAAEQAEDLEQPVEHSTEQSQQAEQSLPDLPPTEVLEVVEPAQQVDADSDPESDEHAGFDEQTEQPDRADVPVEIADEAAVETPLDAVDTGVDESAFDALLGAAASAAAADGVSPETQQAGSGLLAELLAEVEAEEAEQTEAIASQLELVEDTGLDEVEILETMQLDAVDPETLENEVLEGEQLDARVDAQPDAADEAESEDAAAAEAAQQTVEDVEALETLAEAETAIEAEPKQGFSFPDIVPLDEGQSVFDDPAVRMMGGAAAAEQQSAGGFDELIDRAVAQEGAAGTTNSSALILPSMPDTADLTGPLGATGELFITGSIDLPKSLGETGSHPALLDAVEVDPLEEFGFDEQPAAAAGVMAPVSASRAVSATSVSGPLVAEASKDKSKLPVVLISVGGVLVLGAAGLIIWAATNGLFG